MSGNFCHCGAYSNIIAAIRDVRWLGNMQKCNRFFSSCDAYGGKLRHSGNIMVN
ncbi:hypothetical protein [Nostoc sp.]|uniref:hypothetical protein n=1 Tax=Nostoc sp. TaxID=1180 RepID=UPI002FF6152C